MLRMKAIFSLMLAVTPLCAVCQLHPQTPGGGKSGGSRKGAEPKDPYTYGAAPVERPQPQPGDRAGLLNPYFGGPPPAQPAGAKSNVLTLPVLSLQPNGVRSLGPQNLYLPPTADVDTTGKLMPPDTSAGSTGAMQGSRGLFLEPPTMLGSVFTKPEFVDRSPRIIIAATILGYTEDIEPAQYGKDPEQPVSTIPTFSNLGSQSIGLQVMKIEVAKMASLAPKDLTTAPADETIPNEYFRLGNGMTTGRVIPWHAAANMPQETVGEGSGFRLPRALQNLVNVNLHFGLGIPNFSPNIGAITQSYLGLSSIYNYLSPDVADRFQAPYNYNANQRYP